MVQTETKLKLAVGLGASVVVQAFFFPTPTFLAASLRPLGEQNAYVFVNWPRVVISLTFVCCLFV
jgi:hypothetical protein